MADGGLMLEIDEELAEGVRAAAAKKGIPVEMFIRDAIAHHMFAEVEWSGDPDWAIDEQIAEEAELPPLKWRK